MTIKAQIPWKIEDILKFLSPENRMKEKAYKKYICKNILEGKKVLAEMNLIPREEYQHTQEQQGFIARKGKDEYEIVEGFRLIGLKRCHFYRFWKNGLVVYEENPSFPKIGVKKFYQELVDLYVSSLKVEQS